MFDIEYVIVADANRAGLFRPQRELGHPPIRVHGLS